MLPSLNWVLGSNISAIPEHLRTIAIATARRNLQLMQELCALTSLAESQSIPLIHLKGPSLALSAYGDVALRHIGDLDILVREKHVNDMLSILQSRNYLPTFIEHVRKASWAELRRKEVLRTGCEITLQHPETKILVDLHWRLMKPSNFSVKPERIWTSDTTCNYLSHELQVLDPALNFLYLARHAAKHGWSSLKWIADLVAVMESPGFNYDALLELAAASGYLRFALFALCLASYCPGTSLPEPISRKIAQHGDLAKQVTWLLDLMFPEASLEGRLLSDIQAHYFMCSLEDSPLAGLTLFTRDLLEPTLRDWEYLPLPIPLLPLVRQLRLANRYIFQRKC